MWALTSRTVNYRCHVTMVEGHTPATQLKPRQGSFFQPQPEDYARADVFDLLGVNWMMGYDYLLLFFYDSLRLRSGSWEEQITHAHTLKITALLPPPKLRVAVKPSAGRSRTPLLTPPPEVRVDFQKMLGCCCSLRESSRTPCRHPSPTRVIP